MQSSSIEFAVWPQASVYFFFEGFAYFKQQNLFYTKQTRDLQYSYLFPLNRFTDNHLESASEVRIIVDIPLSLTTRTGLTGSEA